MRGSNEEDRRILVIDDHRAIHDDFRKALNDTADDLELADATTALLGDKPQKGARLHYSIDHAFQGLEGIGLVANAVKNNQPYDMAFVDMRMPPGIDGLETVVRLWQEDHDLPVVICTAFSDHSWHDIVERLGCSDKLLILKKPFDISEVRQAALALTEKHRVERKQWQYTDALKQRLDLQMACVRRAHEDAIIRLVNASMYRDKETGAHIKRVGLVSAAIAKAFGCSESLVEMIRIAAQMHDVGKIGIPDAILLKTGALTQDERRLMERHAEIGAKMLSGSDSPVLQMASLIALYHHECWDGTGYPAGLSGEAIPRVARIVAIADFYDAMTHDRVYRPAFSIDETLAKLAEGRGSRFDPHLVDVFLEIAHEIEAISHEFPDRTNAPPLADELIESSSITGEPLCVPK